MSMRRGLVGLFCAMLPLHTVCKATCESWKDRCVVGISELSLTWAVGQSF